MCLGAFCPESHGRHNLFQSMQPKFGPGIATKTCKIHKRPLCSLCLFVAIPGPKIKIRSLIIADGGGRADARPCLSGPPAAAGPQIERPLRSFAALEQA